MSAGEFPTDAERRVCFGCANDVYPHDPGNDVACAMYEDMLTALAPFVAERERAAVENADDAALMAELVKRGVLRVDLTEVGDPDA